ncbi:MAG: hypothetical protein ACYDBW_07820 [Sulfuricaulis sp.]
MTSRKLQWPFVCLMALMFASAALADTKPVPAKMHFGLDYAASVSYHEPIMKETGTLYGLFLDWDSAPARRLTVVGNLSAVLSNLKYDGSVIQTGEPLKSSTSDHIWMGELALGLHLGAAHNTTLYAGIGARNWTDVGSDATTASGTPVSFYRREITYLYAPVGARVGGSLGGRWRLEVDAKYMSLIRGKVRSHLENVNPYYNTLENTQHSGHGYAVGLRFAHVLLDNPTFTESFIEPYYQVWSVPRSDNATLYFAGVPIGYGYEPDNATRIIGVRFGATF